MTTEATGMQYRPDIRNLFFSDFFHCFRLISDPIDVFPPDFEAVPDPEAPFRLQHSIRTMFLCFMYVGGKFCGWYGTAIAT